VLEQHGSLAAALQSCYIHTHTYRELLGTLLPDSPMALGIMIGNDFYQVYYLHSPVLKCSTYLTVFTVKNIVIFAILFTTPLKNLI